MGVVWGTRRAAGGGKLDSQEERLDSTIPEVQEESKGGVEQLPLLAVPALVVLSRLI
jgi:hypothetical protein